MQRIMRSTAQRRSISFCRQVFGMIRTIVEKVEKNESVPDTLEQIESAIGLLKTTKKELLKGYIQTDLNKKWESERYIAVQELLRMYTLFK